MVCATVSSGSVTVTCLMTQLKYHELLLLSNMPRKCTGHNKHPLPTTREKTAHGHHQMANTEIRMIIFFPAKDREAYAVSKNKTGSGFWLR